jgi:RHS repeat-associated protein
VNEYDAAHRLQRHAGAGRTASYRFDDADNLLSQPGLEGVTLLEGNRIGGANAVRFRYNDRNHIEARVGPTGETRYVYDSRDQLVRAETPDGVWEAEYDPRGRRVRKHWRGRTTEYYWSTDQLAAEVRHDGSLRLYVYADALALSPMLLVDYDSTESEPEDARTYVVFSDQIGTPCLIEDQHQRTVWSARVSPFGDAEIEPDAEIECHLRFPGHYLDPELGLHLNRFRYYDPRLARYIQSDPWGISGGLNLYAYRLNPLGEVDVRGLGGSGPEDETPPEDGPSKEGANGSKSGHDGHNHGADPSAFPDLDRGGGDADKHADRVVDVINNTKPPIAKNRSVTVLEHKDGSVSIGVSKGNDEHRSSDAQQVVNDLNQKYPPEPGASPTYRTAPINRDRPLNDGGSRDSPAPLPWNCSETQAAQAAGTHPDSPPKNYQTVWTGPAENPEPYQMPGRPMTPGGNEQMAPCPTCVSNADNYRDMSQGKPPGSGASSEGGGGGQER